MISVLFQQFFHYYWSDSQGWFRDIDPIVDSKCCSLLTSENFSGIIREHLQRCYFVISQSFFRLQCIGFLTKSICRCTLSFNEQPNHLFNKHRHPLFTLLSAKIWPSDYGISSIFIIISYSMCTLQTL